MNEPQLRLVIPEQQIAKRVEELAEEISRKYAGKEVLMIGVLNGVFLFFADLTRKMKVPLRVDFIRLVSYFSETKTTGKVIMTKDVESDLTGKHVIVVEDVVDSGLTIQWLRDHLAGLGAASVEVCVMFDKSGNREVEVDIDYVGFRLGKDYIIGYGMDYDGLYRELSDVYELVEE